MIDKNEALKLLSDLVKINSENPKKNEIKIAKYIKDFLDKNHIENEIVEFEKGRPSVVGFIEGKTNRTIALVGHIDTVSTDPSKWTFDPFSSHIEDGKLYGLGASDMKSGVASIMYAASMLKKNNIKSEYSFLFAFTADEENLYRGAEFLTKKGYFENTSFLIITEPTNLQVFIEEKGELWIRFEFFGKQAHGSTPNKGINTIKASFYFINRVEKEFNKISRGKFPYKSTLNIGKLNGGVQVNIVPDYTSMELDFRLYRTSKEDVIKIIEDSLNKTQKKFKVKTKYEIFNYHPEIRTDANNPFLEKLLKEAKSKHGIATYCTDGATILLHKYIPFAIFGPGRIELAHQPNEYVLIKDYFKAIKILYNFLTSL